MNKINMDAVQRALYCSCKFPENENEGKDEWVWIDGYKGTDKNMCCRDFQYRFGTQFDMPEKDIIMCQSGYHLCKDLKDVFGYYGVENGNRFFKVRALVRAKDVAEYGIYNPYAFALDDNHKLVAKSIEFIREVSLGELKTAMVKRYNNDATISSFTDDDIIVAISKGIDKAKDGVELRKLTESGYSEELSQYIIRRGKYEAACAVASQSDISMDTKIVAIFSIN